MTYEYRLHPVGPLLLSGAVLHAYDHARDAMGFFQAASGKVRKCRSRFSAKDNHRVRMACRGAVRKPSPCRALLDRGAASVG